VTTVLLVDDDAAIRDVGERLLAARGYAVVTAESAEAALAIVGSRADPIDVVATDIVLPGMGGPTLVRRLRARHRGIAALFLSGYAEQSGGNLDAQDLGIDEGAVLLAKPFTGDALAAAVETARRQAPRAV
jgi:two-component system, cell cycle sensor histidine kinase and response regulator CckA